MLPAKQAEWLQHKLKLTERLKHHLTAEYTEMCGSTLCVSSQVGADLCMGSLIKNPGGTIVKGGGYVAGKASLVAAAQARLTAPGVGIDAGSVPGETVRLMMQGRSAAAACV